MDFTIRQARSAELDAVGELTARVYLEDGLLDFGEDDPYLERLRDARSRAGGSELLVAADSGSDEPLGTVAFVAPGSPYAEVSGPGEGEFRMLAVAPRARGRGVAEALVRACLDRAGELGLERVVLSTSDRMLKAHRLYRRLGFVRLPERDWEPIPGMWLEVFVCEL